MISQMNIVQNAARMAMDHRAARPLRRAASPKSGAMIVAGIVLTGLVFALLAFYGV